MTGIVTGIPEELGGAGPSSTEPDESGDGLVLLTVPETAKVLRISRNLAYQLVARDEIPSIRLGWLIRVPRARLEQWLDSGSASSGHRDLDGATERLTSGDRPQEDM